MTSEEIEKKEKEALTSKSTVLKSTEETEAMKEIVKETNRLSIEEKPSFKPASKIACVESSLDENKKETTPSKKRSFEEITDTEKNAEMVGEAENKIGTTKAQEESMSPGSNKFHTAEGEKLEKKSDEKISPNSKRLKLEETPPKVDKLIQSKDAEIEKKDTQNVETKPPVEECKVPETTVEADSKEEDKAIISPPSIVKDVEPSKIESDQKPENPIEANSEKVTETEQTIQMDIDQIIPKEKADEIKADDQIIENKIPSDDKPNSVE